MQARMQARLADLKRDFEEGRRQLHDLVQQEAALRESLLRVSGAIRVLEELLTDRQGPADGAEDTDGAACDRAGRQP
ncbi:hypothetical protein [Streptomyces sp. NPDC006134]|uniref:hypothetical protein n=1 Tax=Streptomyces sp. NPDC006134 TaxID=3154467 RepID=UPI0033DB8E90